MLKYFIPREKYIFNSSILYCATFITNARKQFKATKINLYYLSIIIIVPIIVLSIECIKNNITKSFRQILLGCEKKI